MKNYRNTSLKVATLSAAMSLWIAASPMGVAHAASDTCKNVKISMSNQTGVEIKLTKLEYHDLDKNKWDTENVFGVDGIQKLENNVAMTTTRDLQNVGDDPTELRVTYQHHMGGTKYGDKITTTGSQFTCKDSSSHTVTLTK
jgi:hypothetical protein